MILINVLPDHLRPVKRTPVPYIVAAGLIALALFLVGSLFVGVMAEFARTNAEIAQTEADLKALEPIVEEYNALTEQQLRLKNKIETIQEILSDRKIWSEHLHRLADLTPENFWLSQITTSMIRDTRNVPKLDENGKQIRNANGEPQTVRENFMKPVLEVSGYVINDENGERNITPLVVNTNEDPEFNKHFKITSPSIEDTEFDGFAVRKFKLEYEIKFTPGSDAL